MSPENKQAFADLRKNRESLIGNIRGLEAKNERLERENKALDALVGVWRRKAEVAAEALVTANELVCRYHMPYGWPTFQETCGLPSSDEVRATPVSDEVKELGRKALYEAARSGGKE